MAELLDETDTVDEVQLEVDAEADVLLLLLNDDVLLQLELADTVLLGEEVLDSDREELELWLADEQLDSEKQENRDPDVVGLSHRLLDRDHEEVMLPDVEEDAEPRHLLHARVVLRVALDRVVRAQEASPVVELLTRKGAEGRRAHHWEDEESEHQQPRQGREQHLLGRPAAEPAAVQRNDALEVWDREEHEHDGRRDDHGEEHCEDEVVHKGPQAEALQWKPKPRNVDVEDAEHLEHLLHFARQLQLI